MPDNQTPSAKGSRMPLTDVPIEIIVSVGRARPRIRELLALQAEDVLPLDRRISDPVELYVGDTLIGRGLLHEIEGNTPGLLGVRMTEVVERPEER